MRNYFRPNFIGGDFVSNLTFWDLQNVLLCSDLGGGGFSWKLDWCVPVLFYCVTIKFGQEKNINNFNVSDP